MLRNLLKKLEDAAVILGEDISPAPSRHYIYDSTVEGKLRYGTKRQRQIEDLLEDGLFDDPNDLINWLEGNILDAGIGEGWILKQLQNIQKLYRNDIEVYGIDLISPELKSNNFVRADFKALPYSNNYFDRVISLVSIAAYAETQEDLKKQLSELFRIMALKGEALLTFWTHSNFPTFLSNEERIEDFIVKVERPSSIYSKLYTASDGVFQVKIFEILQEIGFKYKPIYKIHENNKAELTGCFVAKFNS